MAEPTLPDNNEPGYWDAPCGRDVYSEDGTVHALASHIRACTDCYKTLSERSAGPFIQYKEVAEQWEL